MVEPHGTSPYNYAGENLYHEPDAVTVDKIWREYGWHAVAERWFYLNPNRLKEIRRIVTGSQREQRPLKTM